MKKTRRLRPEDREDSHLAVTVLLDPKMLLSYRYIVFIVDLAVEQKILLRTLDFGELLKYLRHICSWDSKGI